MIQIIDSLGGLIPRVLRQIIEISSEIEINQCGAVSNKTLIIQDLYRRVFQPQPNEITVSNPFSSLVIRRNCPQQNLVGLPSWLP